MVDRGRMTKLFGAALLLGLAAWLLLSSFKPGMPSKGNSKAGHDLFNNHAICRIRLEIPAAGVAMLRQNPRTNVSATLWEGNIAYRPVRIHLKGTSSFRPIDAKPSFTIHFVPTNTPAFHGLRKIHLNNAVEDPSCLNEILGSELFRAARYPALRSSHALVELNGRPLGLYVLKEGFNAAFLARQFTNAAGNFYEPKDGHDIDRELEWHSGARPNDPADVRALWAAVQEPELARRWERLGQVLDTDRFITFMAMEVMIGHRDGYSMARNNFRLYHNPSSDRLVFLPHGMDQLFGKPDLTWQPSMQGLVAKAVMETPEGRRRYQERFRRLFATVFQATTISNHIQQWSEDLRQALSRAEGKEIARHTTDLQQRLSLRHEFLRQQLAAPERKPLAFIQNQAALTGWQAVDVPKDGKMEVAPAPDGRMALRIQAGPVTAAAWRTTVLLPPGRYDFEGLVQLKGVVPTDFSRNRGAGLRVGGATGKPHDFTGDWTWRKLSIPLEIKAQVQEVELRCELFAKQGEVWFALESLRLLREP